MLQCVAVLPRVAMFVGELLHVSSVMYVAV